MLSILVANIKGGCGKTTVATQLAGWCAAEGHATLLADVDRQRSSLGWLQRRPPAAAAIGGADWVKEIADVPRVVERLVIDAPAALKTRQIEDLVAAADLVVLPVLPSAFDEGATRRFLDRLEDLKAIAKHRKPVAVVGNRVRPRTRAAEQLDLFLADIGHSVLTRLRDSQTYPALAANGLSLFDPAVRRVAPLREDWAPLLGFIAALARSSKA